MIRRFLHRVSAFFEEDSVARVARRHQDAAARLDTTLREIIEK